MVKIFFSQIQVKKKAQEKEDVVNLLTEVVVVDEVKGEEIIVISKKDQIIIEVVS